MELIARECRVSHRFGLPTGNAVPLPSASRCAVETGQRWALSARLSVPRLFIERRAQHDPAFDRHDLELE